MIGASSGFGVEFARRFAARGDDLVLVARRSEPMAALAAELLASHGATAHVVPLDLTEPDAPARLLAAVAERDLAVHALVNSAGFGSFGPFAATDPDRIAREIALNVTAVTVLSRLFLPALLAAPAGVLLNVASTAAYLPGPNLAVYAATKAYVRSLTEAIWAETRGTGLTVLALSPGPTQTEFFAAAGSDGFKVGQILTVAEVVDVAFHALGRRNPPPSVVAGPLNKLTAVVAGLVPRRVSLAVARRLTAQ
ncbi:SDR family NAD(P)-dependent oxidoreductase [Pengzhenrongella sicca]|uniref:SDR family NAD(P)-dependent oxidoreductase n=1 Tax=Pengzhenrongella sicca TaxID=2819238 RepID=UPI001D0C2D7C|nr:SDR family NAD(P)-dependent oxidoreductase [Pengzhenrongella sicca]